MASAYFRSESLENYSVRPVRTQPGQEPSTMNPLPPSDPSDSFAGLRVAVTGGTSGLGLALVRELRRRGARVAFVARTPGRVEQVAREHPGTHGIVGDVSVKDDVHPLAMQIVGELG